MTNWARVPRIGRDVEGLTDDAALHALLDALGDTADAVAETLRAQDCTGPPFNDCFCPVAAYITKHTGKAASAAAYASSTGIFGFRDGIPVSFDPRSSTRTPEPVAAMITAYDRGAYDFLRPD